MKNAGIRQPTNQAYGAGEMLAGRIDYTLFVLPFWGGN